MTKRPLKLLPVFAAISAVVIIAGVILMALLGFDLSPQRPRTYSFELRYDVSVQIDEAKSEKLETLCETTLEANGITINGRQDGDDLSLDMKYIKYELPITTDEKALSAAKTAIENAIAADEQLSEAIVSVDYHRAIYVGGLYDAATLRGSIAAAVGVVVGLIYLAVRFGVGNALTGCVLCAHDALVTLSLLAILRIPTYTYAPLLFAAAAAFCSLLFWVIHCAQLRDAKKDATLRNLTSAESVEYAWENSWKKILIIAAAGIFIFAVAGSVAAAGVRLALLPLMISVATAAYSTVLLGPALHVHVRKAFDKFASKHKPRYIGKKKAEKSSASEASEN